MDGRIASRRFDIITLFPEMFAALTASGITRRALDRGLYEIAFHSPREFVDNLHTYGREDAIVFRGIDFFQVWLLLMLGRWRTLARHFVQLPGAPARDEEAVVAFLRARTAPIPR